MAAAFTAQAWWRHPHLSRWHTTCLANAFNAGAAAPQPLPDYHAQEARLFAELRKWICASPGAGGEVNELDTEESRTHALGHVAAHSIPPWATTLIHGKSLAKNWRRFAGLFPSLLSEFPILPTDA
jgi:hypothetical protein